MSTIAKVLKADVGKADVNVVDWDRVFSYELKIYNRATPPVKVAEIVGDMKNATLASLEFTLLRNGGCGPFSFILGEEYAEINIDYNYRVEICFYTQSDPWFTGYITELPQKGTDPSRRYAGVGYFQQLEHVRVNEADTAGQDVANIVKDIYDDYLNGDTDIEWNTDKIDTPIYTTAATQFWERITARACFETLAELAQQFEFGVDAERDFYFRAISPLVLEKFWIGKHLTEFKPTEDQSDLCNRLYIRCGRLTDGTDYTIMLDRPGKILQDGLREDVVRVPEFWPIFSNTNLAIGSTPTVNPILGGIPGNMIDGNPATLWQSGVAPQAVGHWIQIDLGMTYDHIAMVVLDSDDPAAQEYYARGFTIEISATGAFTGEQVQVFITNDNSTYKPIITFTPTSGRYVRITLTVPHANEWRVGEFEIYELTTTDIERWGNYILDERKDIKKKATATIIGVDKLINLRSTLGPIEPRGLVGIYDENGVHIDDYANVACQYSLTPESFDLTMELGAQASLLPSYIRKMLQQLKEFDMSGVRNVADLSAGVGPAPGIITRTMIGKDVIEVPHLKGEKISLYGGLIELGKGVMSGGGHGYVVKSPGPIWRVEIGRLNADYGMTIRDSDGNITMQLGSIVGAMDWTEVSISWGVNDVSRNSDVWADLADMSINFTTRKGTIIIYMDNFVDVAAFAPDLYATCFTRWNLDAAPQGEMLYSTDILNAANFMTASGPYNVNAGAHTLKLEWKCGSNNQTWWSRARVVQAVWWNRVV